MLDSIVWVVASLWYSWGFSCSCVKCSYIFKSRTQERCHDSDWEEWRKRLQRRCGVLLNANKRQIFWTLLTKLTNINCILWLNECCTWHICNLLLYTPQKYQRIEAWVKGSTNLYGLFFGRKAGCLTFLFHPLCRHLISTPMRLEFDEKYN